jgi:hypothetical protein
MRSDGEGDEKETWMILLFDGEVKRMTSARPQPPKSVMDVWRFTSGGAGRRIEAGFSR